MKLVVAGSRSIKCRNSVYQAIADSGFAGEVTHVITGRSRGVDEFAEEWAMQQRLPVIIHRPDFKAHKSWLAPKVRNWTMGEIGDALVAVWDGFSGGTAHMISVMGWLSKPVYVVRMMLPVEELVAIAKGGTK